MRTPAQIDAGPRPRPGPTRAAWIVGSLTTVTVAVAGVAATIADVPPMRNPAVFENTSGKMQTFTTEGRFDPGNPFFTSLGTNGRACVTCHEPADAWSVSVASLRKRFRESRGLDPVFRPNDGAISPNADVSTFAARKDAYRMLLDHGVFRIGIGIPANAEFELAAADDPYGFAGASELSLFRRPLPATNLRFLSAVMWDGRETVQPIHTPFDGGDGLAASLRHQANDATLGHAQASRPLTEAEMNRIVRFEMSTYTAQLWDNGAGKLNRRGGRGGALYLAAQPFYIGVNDVLGADPFHLAFDPASMLLYADMRCPSPNSPEAAIVRGEAIFNNKSFAITGVKGLNDALNIPAIPGTCTSCHNTPNVGNHSLPLPVDIGISDASRRTPDMPLYTLRSKATGETIQTTDPGLALITGKWADVGKFKGPVLRGLAARAPYFHNGFAKSLDEVVDFYDSRFGIGFTKREKADLAAFLKTL